MKNAEKLSWEFFFVWQKCCSKTNPDHCNPSVIAIPKARLLKIKILLKWYRSWRWWLTWDGVWTESASWLQSTMSWKRLRNLKDLIFSCHRFFFVYVAVISNWTSLAVFNTSRSELVYCSVKGVLDLLFLFVAFCSIINIPEHNIIKSRYYWPVKSPLNVTWPSLKWSGDCPLSPLFSCEGSSKI